MKYLSIFLSLVVFGLVLWFDVPRLLGAHPWWSQKVALIGMPLGIALGLIPRNQEQKRRLFWTGVAFIIAISLAHFGKLAFANSYAENKFAGQVWFFGWVIASGALAAFALTFFRLIGLQISKNLDL